MNYDEAIKELYVLYTDVVIPEDEAKFNHYKKLNITELFDKFRFVKSVLETAKKEHELLDLYRLQQEFKERYNTQVRVLDRQETLNDIREIAEEIYLKEKEIDEELK